MDTSGQGSSRGTDGLRFDRIAHLISPEVLRDKIVLQVGVGSGGAAVNDHLTMNGVRRWILFDPDTYDDVNLVKHPRLRSQLGIPKVSSQREWIVDRNPAADVREFAEDVMSSAGFADSVQAADLVLCCADRNDVRSFVNASCVEHHRPCVTASVFRQGYGGEVYAYLPGVSGCYECMVRVADEQGWNVDDAIEPTKEEEETIYGLGLREYKASGLSMDIQAVATIQARIALDLLMPERSRKLSPLPANWVVVYNRPIPSIQGSGFLRATLLRVKPRKDCRCSEG